MPFIFFILLSIAGASGVHAQESRFSVGGFVDGYYAFDFSRPPSRDRSFTTQPLRHNEFNINLALVDVRYDDGRVRGRLALQSGTYVEANYALETPTLQRLHEGYLGVRLGRSGWWVDMGVFGSHIGFEGAVSIDQWHYSRSLMADFSPFYEAGIKLSGPLSKSATFGFVVVNGWQNIRETNDSKAFGWQLRGEPNAAVLLNWSTFFGNEAPDDTPSRFRIFDNVYARFRLSNRLETAAVFDLGLQKRPVSGGYDTWYATALLARYTVTSAVRLGGRVEYYADGQEVIVTTALGNGFETFGASVNLDYAVAAYFLWRIEARVFHAKDAVYPSPSGFDRTSGFIATSFAMRVD